MESLSPWVIWPEIRLAKHAMEDDQKSLLNNIEQHRINIDKLYMAL